MELQRLCSRLPGSLVCREITEAIFSVTVECRRYQVFLCLQVSICAHGQKIYYFDTKAPYVSPVSIIHHGCDLVSRVRLLDTQPCRFEIK